LTSKMVESIHTGSCMQARIGSTFVGVGLPERTGIARNATDRTQRKGGEEWRAKEKEVTIRKEPSESKSEWIDEETYRIGQTTVAMMQWESQREQQEQEKLSLESFCPFVCSFPTTNSTQKQDEDVVFVRG
jgi:hypothetical protein